MKTKFFAIFFFTLCFSVYSQQEEILIKLVDITDKKLNILTQNGVVSIDEKIKEIEVKNPEALAIGINLYKANLMEKYLKGITNKELIELFVEDYSLGIKKEKELLAKMTLTRTEKKAYGSLLKDEENVIKKLSDKYK